MSRDGGGGNRTTSEEVDFTEVFRRAAEEYKKLRSKRKAIAREIAKVDRAIARLENPTAKDVHAVHRALVRSRPGPRAERRPSSEVANGRHDPVKLAHLVVRVLTKARAPLSFADLAAAVRRRVPASNGNLQNLLRNLRKKGLVETRGVAPSYLYSLARAPRPSDFESPGWGKPGKPKGAPSVRAAILETIRDQPYLTWAELKRRVLEMRPDINPITVTATLGELRKTGVVEVAGVRRLYRYFLA
jgi:hypothetical protein